MGTSSLFVLLEVSTVPRWLRTTSAVAAVAEELGDAIPLASEERSTDDLWGRAPEKKLRCKGRNPEMTLESTYRWLYLEIHEAVFRRSRNQLWRVNSGLFLLIRIYAWLLELMAMRLEAKLFQIWPVDSNVVLHNRSPQIPWPSIGDEWRHAGDVSSMQGAVCCASLQSSMPYWRRSCWEILHPKSSQYQELTSEQQKETKHVTKSRLYLHPFGGPPCFSFFFRVAATWQQGHVQLPGVTGRGSLPRMGAVTVTFDVLLPDKCQRLDIISH